ITAGSTDGTVRLWDLRGDRPRSRALPVIPPDVPWLHGIALSPEGRHLAVCNPNGTVYVLRLAKRGEVFEVPPRAAAACKKSLPGHTEAVISVAYSPDGRLLASGDEAGEVRVWGVPSGKLRYVLPVVGPTVHALALSPDGKSLLTASAA